MPVNRFEIKNTGPIKYARIDNLPSVVIIAGPNGVGKSTLLETLKKQSGIFMEGTGKLLYIPPYRTPVTFSLHKSLPFIGPRTRFVDILTSDNFSIHAPGISLPHYIISGGPRSRSAPDFAPYFEVKYKLVQFQQEFEHTLAEVFNKLGGEIPKGQMPADIYKTFRDLVKMLLPGIQFDHVALEGEEYKVYFINRMGIRVDFDQLSSGEKDIIAMLFPFIEKEVENELSQTKSEKIPHEDLVIMIDSPEAYLHPILQRNLLSYVRSSVKKAESKGEKLQFFIATHSTTITNEATSEELYVMVFPDQSLNGNQIIKITSDEEKLHLIQDILGDIGLASLTTGKPILLLEGKSDVEISKLLKPDIEERFTLLHLGGKGKILAFSETFEKVMLEIVSRGFKIFALLDKDKESFAAKSDFCFTWPRACIENFLLLDSGAIYEALKVTVGEVSLQDKGIKTEKDIDNLIEEIIKNPEVLKEEIKQRAEEHLKFHITGDWEDLEGLKKVSSEILDKRLARFEEQYEKLNNEIKQVVNDKEKALVELNGKIILGKISSRFNVRRDYLARTIADKLRILNRLPRQITDLIEQIEKVCKKPHQI